MKIYLQQRGLLPTVYSLVKEVHFAIGEKKLYAIGFENLSGGWELRNQFYKGSLLKKDISVVNLNNNLKKNKILATSIVFHRGGLFMYDNTDNQKGTY